MLSTSRASLSRQLGTGFSIITNKIDANVPKCIDIWSMRGSDERINKEPKLSMVRMI